MNILLDTCTFLWIITDNTALSQSARVLFSNPENTIYLSVISIWEIIIKYKMNKLSLPKPPQSYLQAQCHAHDINILSLDAMSVEQLAKLAEYHKDPFDKMLVCQAVAHNLTILTPDHHICQYPIAVTW